ncbi:MAG TPA: carboxypeptidase regulatory-like domain-containing protein [Thermoanaerobaculia bacterium]|jgi:protocatechuate 3,4-dioxygenase beta subunit|nr:carboxypeptidase regulatory-like domain-containing protein [Thermoanaerobaculia bacterium]
MSAIRRLLCISIVLSSFVAPVRAAVIGTVINIDGKAVAGAKVSLYAPELIAAQGPRMLLAEPQRKALLTATSDSGGKFSLDVPKDQTVVDVRIEAAGYGPSSVRAVSDDDLGAILLPQAASVHGTVTASGKPVANATVILLGGAEYITTTDAAGHYTAPDPSKWAARILLIHPDYAVVEELIGPAGTKKGPDFSMTTGVAVTGRVVAEDGQTPVGDAQIFLDGWPSGKSAADGTFTIPHAGKDWQTVEARSGNRIAQRVRATGAPGAVSATLKLGKGATVSGSVRDLKSQLPVVGARVSISPSGGGRRFAAARDAFADAITDAKGNFTIEPVVAGSYAVRSGHPGYAINGAQSLNLKAATTAQKAFYASAHGRIIGTVIDDGQRPVAAARLTTRPATRNDRFAFLPARFGGGSEAYSAPDGHFVLRSVETEADLQVDALKRGYPDGKSPSLKLASGERRAGLTITIPRGIAVTGRVTDKDHKPVSGVGVEAIEAAADARGGGIRRMIVNTQSARNDETVRTGSDGTFTIRVKEGTYDLNFKREGYSAKSVRGTKVDAATKPLEVMLNPGVEITGRVTRAGAPVEGVTIRAISQDGFSTAATGADGSFAITDLTPGTMMLNASKDDSFIQEMRSVTAPARDVLIDLPAGGRITGHVLDKNTHDPVTSFQAGVTTSRSGGGMVVMMPPMQKQFTSDDGSFVLDGVKPGTTQVIVSAPGYTTAHVPNIEVVDGKTAPDVEVDVETGSKLTGHVSDASGTPLSGVAVGSNPMGGGGGRVMRFDGNASGASTDPNGDYTIDSLDPGDLTFTFTKNGYIAQQKTVTVTSGKDARLDAQLSSGMSASGTVVSDGGTPIPDVTVRAMSASEMDGAHEGRTDANGAFTIDGLAPGHFTFTAAKAGFAPNTLRDVDISSSGPVHIILSGGGVITGHVNGLTAQELDQATVSATVSGGGGGGGGFLGGGGGNLSVPVDASGNFRIEGAPSGTVRVSARTGAMFGGASKTAAPKTVQLDAGGTAQVDIDFIASTVIQGTITRNGSPISNAQVTFIPRGAASPTTASAPADANGHYSLSGLGDGTYVVQVMDMSLLTPFATQYEVHGSDTFDITIKAVTVRGRVVDATDTHPLNGANVEIRSTGQTPLGSRAAQTDSSGNFTIDNVAAGTYQISADKTSYGHDARSITVTDTPPEDVQFQLSPSDGITIRAVDTRDNTTLTVNVLRVIDSQGNEIPSQGGFFGSNEVVKLALAPGVYQVTVSARNYAAQTLSMSSPSQQTIRFSPGGTLVLHSRSTTVVQYRLVDSSGTPYGMNSFSMGVNNLQPGATTLNNVPAGHYQLQVLNNTNGVTRTVEIDVVDGQQRDYDV